MIAVKTFRPVLFLLFATFGAGANREMLQATTVGADLLYDQLQQTAGAHGPVKKAGMLPPDRWRGRYNDKKMKDLAEMVYNTSALLLPDAPRRLKPFNICTVLVNHHYKFIFIKNTKTAGTAIFSYFGLFCNPDESRPDCMQPLDADHSISDEDMSRIWREYFVFGVARNPWARAASSYDYVLLRRLKAEGIDRSLCRMPTFPDFCKDPAVAARQSVLWNCFRTGSSLEWLHDFGHVEPLNSCMADDSNNLVVDYVMQVETINSDFQRVLRRINKGRPEGLPALTGKLSVSNHHVARPTAGNNKASLRTYHTQYTDCGQECVSSVAEYYKEDLMAFGYSNLFLEGL